MADDAVLAAVREALERQPDSVPLRLHFASLLLNSGAEARALEHFSIVLMADPTNLDALEGASKAALALGDAKRAAAYGQLVAALRAGTWAEPDPPLVENVDDSVPTKAAVQDSRDAPDGAEESPWWEVALPGITLADVGGLASVKQRIEASFLGPLRNPELRAAFGVSLRGGLLLYGPPGCGKTFLARGTAGELGAHFMSVGLSDVLDMWVGMSERNLHSIFEAARRASPCVLFFDEVDALGQRRTQLRHHAAVRGVVNQLLAEMDGVNSTNEGVYVLAASNHPWDIDPALLRPGRLDRMALVEPPDSQARAAILRYHLRDRPTSDVDVEAIARRTERFSGADLAHICQSAAEIALSESTRAGRVIPIGQTHLQQAMRDIRPSTGAWFETARNFVLFANDSGTYDDLANYMRDNKLL